MKRMLLAVVLGLVACGGDENNANNANNVNNVNNQNNSNNQNNTELRNVRTECSAELDRLEGCGQATTEEAAQIKAMLCDSTDFTDGQVASIVDCLAQWDCAGTEPACLGEDPMPQCTENADCGQEMICVSQTCQPDDADVSCTLICDDLEDRCENTSAKCTTICASLQPSLECVLCLTDESCDAIDGGSCDQTCSN